jgi:hypothetical protein
VVAVVGQAHKSLMTITSLMKIIGIERAPGE